MIEIKLFKDRSLKGYSLIEGFPGIGLVGPMAASYMIEKLEMEYIGYIRSDLFPPIAAVHNGIPMNTARIYADTKDKLVVVLSEFTIPTSVVYQLGSELMSFMRKNGIGNIISIGGTPTQKQGPAPYIISSDSAMVKKAAAQGIKRIQEGVIAGVSAVLMTSADEFGITASNLLVEVNPVIMDPKYAKTAIQGLQKLTGLKIDLADLDKETKEVEARVREMLKKAKDTHEHYNEAAAGAGAEGPSMYA